MKEKGSRYYLGESLIKGFIPGFIFLLLPFFAHSQGEWNKWYFGDHAALDFNSGTPVTLFDNAMWDGAMISTSVSDSNGNLLFYGNYESVWNRNHQIMSHGSGLLGGNNANQHILAVPKLGEDSSYYIFTVGDNDNSVNGLCYSILDMRLDGGLGDINPFLKNIHVSAADSAYEYLTAIRHHNNHDIWIVVLQHHANQTSTYEAFLITDSGLNTTPVKSPSLIIVPAIKCSHGTIRISQDGKKMVCTADTIPAEVSNFDPLTGEITPLFHFLPQQGTVSPTRFPQGIEFSIDGRFLYVSLIDANFDSLYGPLFQYDAKSQDSLQFIQSEFLVGYEARGNIQMGPDGKIYVPPLTWNFPPWNSHLHVIENPSIQGTGCNFHKNVVDLLPRFTRGGLPQFLQRYYAYLNHTGSCQFNSVFFSGTIWPPSDSVSWDFGDPTSGSSNFSNDYPAYHTYNLPGDYNVRMIVRHIDKRFDTAYAIIHIDSTYIPLIGPDQTICAGDSVTFDAGACAGCAFLWADYLADTIVSTSQTFKTGSAGIYTVKVTNSYGCKGFDTIQLFVTTPPMVTTTPLSKAICSGDSTRIPLTSDIPGATFSWTGTGSSALVTGFSDGTGDTINQKLTSTSTTDETVTYWITPTAGNCTGDSVAYVVTVLPGDSVSVSIAASQNPVCEGTSVTFTATPVNGGTTPVFQWYVNGVPVGINSSILTYVPGTGDQVTCDLTSSETVCVTNNPATSNSILMVIDSNLLISVSISASANPVCAGTSVTYTAIPVNGGTAPVFQWYVDGIPAGTNSPVFTYVPGTGDQVTCDLTSSETVCVTNNPATSNSILMVIDSNLLVSVSISASANPVCEGTSVTFTATPVNEGTTPSYQWKVNGINSGLDNPVFAYIPVNNDIVTCVLTSSETVCVSNNPATSNAVTMTVNPVMPVSITIAASANPVCEGTSVTYTAIPVNGGTAPVFQWYVDGIPAGTNSPVFTYVPSNGNSVSCLLNSDYLCTTGNPAMSNPIIMNVVAKPVVTFQACFDTITTVNAKPIKLKGGIPLGGTYSGPGVNTGIFYPAIAGPNTHIITYTYTNAGSCSSFDQISIVNYPLSIINCGSPIIDRRDNKVYPTVQIGTQCWLASNLNYGNPVPSAEYQRDNCIPEKYCYNDIPANCSAAGGPTANSYYQWDELMAYDATPGNQGLCPPAWHVPTEAEWNTLFANYINNAFAGSPLKYSGYSGFNALLTGAKHFNKAWNYSGFAAFFWSSTSWGPTKAWAHGMNDPDPSVSWYPSYRTNAFSVRCIKD